jgi:hypothetical protein
MSWHASHFRPTFTVRLSLFVLPGAFFGQFSAGIESGTAMVQPPVSGSQPVGASNVATRTSPANSVEETPVTEATGGGPLSMFLSDKVELTERLNALEKARSQDLVRQFPSPSLQSRHERILTETADSFDFELDTLTDDK